jgi:UDP-N-acetylglucosamine 2-epimerase (non-hydrolysing)
MEGRWMPEDRTPITHVVGARPNFMKAAPVIEALADLGAAQQVVHTGQHYDERLSAVFFDQLGIRKPDVNLGVGSGTHAQQTAALLTGLEATFEETPPRAVVVYGDVNSTLAAALVCAKLGIPSVHVEAGLRSFDDTMPEEINRRVTDALADLLLVTSPEALDHLAREGRPREQAHLVGNTMIDTLARNLDRLEPDPVRAGLGLPADYGVVTLHRPSNVDAPEAARAVAGSVNRIAEGLVLVVPLHPRGRAQLAEAGLVDGERTRVVEPLGYVEFLSLVRGARLVLTDSGGVQEETTILDVPCLTMRPNTERPITISHGTNRLVTPDEAPGAAHAILAGEVTFPSERPPLWDGAAGPRCAKLIAERYL